MLNKFGRSDGNTNVLNSPAAPAPGCAPRPAASDLPHPRGPRHRAVPAPPEWRWALGPAARSRHGRQLRSKAGIRQRVPIRGHRIARRLRKATGTGGFQIRQTRELRVHRPRGGMAPPDPGSNGPAGPQDRRRPEPASSRWRRLPLPPALRWCPAAADHSASPGIGAPAHTRPRHGLRHLNLSDGTFRLSHMAGTIMALMADSATRSLTRIAV